MKTLKTDLKKYSMLIALIIIFIIFAVLTNGINLTPNNISNMIMQYAYVLVLAVGMLLVIITGNIDLSVGSVVGFTGAVAGVLMVRNDVPVPVAIVLILIVGLIIGATQGFFIAYIGVPAFITTLAGMMIFRGLTMVVLNGESLGPFPDSFKFFANGFIFQNSTILGLNTFTFILMVIVVIGIILGTIYKYKKTKIEFRPNINSVILQTVILTACIEFILYNLGAFKGISVPFIILTVLITVYSYFMNNITYGRQIYAIGGNYAAAQMSGIKNKKVIFWVYANMGVLAALSGILVAGRLNSATPNAGNMFELDAIAACFIGGASATGGTGTIIGAVIGALIMASLNNGMSILGVSVDWQQAVKGLVLLIAVVLDVMSRRKKS
ncbi:MAG: multiple monosaccharide ABC transporter permease [Mycoplasmatales bacterium]